MSYIKRTTIAGKTIEVEYYYTDRYNKRGYTRKDKVKPTKEAQKKINTKNRERKLRLLINANYGYGDYHIVLDYIRKKGKPDRTKEEMRKDIDKFLRECRKLYKAAGKIFKYIHVMEIGKKGARHHHLVVNNIDIKVLQQAWYKAYEGHNRIKVFPLDDTGQYKELASYLIKYTDKYMGTEKAIQGKSWNASKNLVIPEPIYEIVTKRAWYRCEPKAKKGYYIDKNTIVKGVNSPEYGGYGFFKYTMVRLQ